MLDRLLLSALLLMAGSPAWTQPTPEPIIDMHLHAEPAAEYGPPGGKICLPYQPFPTRDPGRPIEEYLRDFTGNPVAHVSPRAPATDDEIRDRRSQF